MINGFHLRPVTEADAAAMLDTLMEGFESYREWAGPSYDPPPRFAEANRMLEGIRRPSFWGVIAFADGAIAGHVTFTQARAYEPPRAEVPGIAHLGQLFIRRPWWGSGLATRLNRLAVEEAARRGYERIRLRTPAGQDRARAFYEREGWSTDGERTYEPLLGIDLVEYRLDLR